MPTSDLIQFKRGTQESLNTLMAQKKGTDGCFYLTVDDSAGTPKASRLYVGRANGEIVPVNQGIVTINSVNDLSTFTANHVFSAGDFAYVKDKNILAVYSGGQWIQINAAPKDEYLSDLKTAVSASEGTATVTTTGKMKEGAPDRTTSFTITGEKGITITGTGTALTLTGDEYNLSTSYVADSNKVTVQLSSDKRADAGSVDVVGGTNVTVTKNASDALQISSVDTKIKTVAIDTNTESGTGFRVGVQEDQHNIWTRGEIDPIVAYGDTGTKEAKFTNGKATLEVYSKSDIDYKLKSVVNPMTYKGVIGSTSGAAAATPSGITSAELGDTFKIAEAMTLDAALSTSGQSVSLKVGDLLIAQGTEDPTTGKITSSTLKFDYIPSGDDTDHTYGVASKTNGLILNDTTNGGTIKVGSLTVNGGTAITVAESGTTDKELTINHGTITRSDTTGAIVNNSTDGRFSLDVVTGVTSDNQGHVTGITTQKANIDAAIEQLNTYDVTATANSNTITVSGTITTKNKFTGIQSATKTGTFTLSSDNLSLSASGNAITANYVWGTF